MEDWKVNRFIKETRDMKATVKYLTENYSLIKEFRMGAICQAGDPPHLTQLGFNKACEISNIEEHFVTKSVQSSHFNPAATINKSKEENKTSMTKVLSRFEFMQILIRIAHVKYIKTEKIPKS